MQPIVLPSITVFAVEIVDGPAYAVRAVPDGTPVLLASGNPLGVGTVVGELVGELDAVLVGELVGELDTVLVGELVGVLDEGLGVGIAFGVAVTVAVTVALAVAVALTVVVVVTVTSEVTVWCGRFGPHDSRVRCPCPSAGRAELRGHHPVLSVVLVAA
jgi:hypothetical protein